MLHLWEGMKESKFLRDSDRGLENEICSRERVKRGVAVAGKIEREFELVRNSER